LKSFDLRKENKAMITLNIGVNIKTKSPRLITPQGCNLDKLDKSFSMERGSFSELWDKFKGAIKNKINPTIRMIKAE
jgi:hypothetical protein